MSSVQSNAGGEYTLAIALVLLVLVEDDISAHGREIGVHSSLGQGSDSNKPI
ncbi:hypothetical protein [Nostoc sp. CENA543]|uniref:hypothetical protein n=1 Tax=Nostoc sp. CENA543 TaxID=1869241 RepID=UPI0012FFE942|nr:hypothetical protein [Nostoc sp. CENA543]